MSIFLVDSNVPFVFERRTEAARDALIASFFIDASPRPIVSAPLTDDPASIDNPEISIVRAYVGRWTTETRA